GLPLASVLIFQLGAFAASPSIDFLRPIKGEHFYDYPIYIQVSVRGFKLIPLDKPSAGNASPDAGHISYSLDDYPLYQTDDTQIMIGKFLGNGYLPVGWHVLRAELVDINNHPLKPPVLVSQSVFTGHPANVEADHAQEASLKAETVAEELYKMRVHLEE